MEAEFSKCEPTCAKDEDTSSTEGLIDEHEEVPKGKHGKYTEQSSKEEVEPGPLDLDLLDSAFIREGTTLEEEKENVRDTDGSDDGLYDFSDVPEVAQFPKIPKNYLWITQQARTQYECIYGKRYTVRRVKPVDPSLLPPLMSLKVSLPEGIEPKPNIFESENEEEEIASLVQVFRNSSQRQHHVSSRSSRSTSSSDQDYRQLRWYYTNVDVQRYRSRQEPRRPSSRDRRRGRRDRQRRTRREPVPSRRYRHRCREEERVHRSPTAIERYRYWTGREYRSRLAVRSPIRRRRRSSS